MRTTIGNGLDVATSPQVLHAHLSKVLLDIAQVLTGRKIVFEMKTERSRSATQVAYTFILVIGSPGGDRFTFTFWKRILIDNLFVFHSNNIRRQYYITPKWL